MNRIKCFMLVPTTNVRMSLRRYKSAPWVDGKSERNCPNNHGYHDAQVLISQGPLADSGASLYEGDPVIGDNWSHEDPRWPIKCSCGYEFQPEDKWSSFPEKMFANPKTGEEHTKREAPAGAIMDNTEWGAHFAVSHYEDGKHYECKLPDGTWWGIDQKANNGSPENPGWRRTGVPPELTVTPSILTPGYHGFLTAGHLDEC
jgi:hypothetical protein